MKVTMPIVLIFLLTAAGAGADIETVGAGVEKDADIWVKVERLGEAEALIANGLRREARLLLDSLLERYPDYGDAKKLYDSLVTDDVSGGLRDSTAVLKSDKAEVLWREYNECKRAANLSGARKKLLEIKNLYTADDVMPPFLLNLEKEYANIEKEIENALAGVFADIERKLSGVLQLDDLDARLTGLIKLYASIERVLLENGDLHRIIDLKERILRQLDKVARIAYSKAAVVKELEGCLLAAPVFKKLADTLVAPELEIYQMAKKEAKACDR